MSQYNPECCTNIVKFASCIEMPSGFDSASIICLPGLFALDVCASIHLYASNASAPLHSVLFSVIVVETMEERAVSVKQIHWGLHVAKKCGQGLKGALFSVFLACLR